MAQPIADKTQNEQQAVPNSVGRPVLNVPQFSLQGAGQAVESYTAQVRRETATDLLAGILSGPSGSSGGIEAVTDRALEWADMLLGKLAK